VDLIPPLHPGFVVRLGGGWWIEGWTAGSLRNLEGAGLRHTTWIITPASRLGNYAIDKRHKPVYNQLDSWRSVMGQNRACRSQVIRGSQLTKGDNRGPIGPLDPDEPVHDLHGTELRPDDVLDRNEAIEVRNDGVSRSRGATWIPSP
jgi:hypothetical protein